MPRSAPPETGWDASTRLEHAPCVPRRSRRRLVHLLKEKATIERLAYDYEAAKATLRQLLALEPDRGWIDLGDLFVTTGNLNQADAAYRKARETA